MKGGGRPWSDPDTCSVDQATSQKGSQGLCVGETPKVNQKMLWLRQNLGISWTKYDEQSLGNKIDLTPPTAGKLLQFSELSLLICNMGEKSLLPD